MRETEKIGRMARSQKSLRNIFKIGGRFDAKKIESAFVPIEFRETGKELYRDLRDLFGGIYTFKVEGENGEEYNLTKIGRIKNVWEDAQDTRYAASIFGIFGIGLIIASGTRITGNIIGSLNENISISLSGILLILIALTLFLTERKDSNF